MLAAVITAISGRITRRCQLVLVMSEVARPEHRDYTAHELTSREIPRRATSLGRMVGTTLPRIASSSSRAFGSTSFSPSFHEPIDRCRSV
jgi:hypothetical protein